MASKLFKKIKKSLGIKTTTPRKKRTNTGTRYSGRPTIKEQVKTHIKNLSKREFGRKDIRAKFPDMSNGHISAVLEELIAENRIKKVSRGVYRKNY